MRPTIVSSALLLALSLAGGGLRTAAAQGGTPAPEDRHAADAAMHEMSHQNMADDPHLRMTAARPGTAADSARAAELVVTIRSALAKYRDVKVALQEGFEQFLPNVPLPVYHFTNYRYGLVAAFTFDPTRPTSLLYRKNSDGSFTLTGVMYTAPQRIPEEALDQRIPLGIARWHQHIDWCLPKAGEERRWTETRGGTPLFGPRGPISTREACDAVNGRFLPHLFGWMVHVNAFESDDPAVIWGDHH